MKVEFLARRHRQFTTFWNANADVSKDSPAHKTAAELRKDLERWEATMEKERKEQAKAEKVGVPSDREIMVRLFLLLLSPLSLEKKNLDSSPLFPFSSSSVSMLSTSVSSPSKPERRTISSASS